MKKVSILIPVYNEESTILALLEKVNSAQYCSLEKEIIIVNDASTDNTLDLLSNLDNNYRIYTHSKNKGKGAAIKTALQYVTGDIVVIQDADLEYEPYEYEKLLPLILTGEADAVFGSRLKEINNKKSFLLTSFAANKFLTFMTNILFGAELTDMETCFKAVKSNLITNLNIKSDRFDFEPEITAKLLKQNIKIREVAISYNGRQHFEGKKITWIDGIQAVWTLIKYKFTD